MELNSLEKSIWREQRNKDYKFFCPLCSSARKASIRPNPYQPILVFRVLMTSALITLGLFPWLGFKGFVSFFPLWVGFEFIYRSKARQQIECPHCGFDPFTYLAAPERANAQVKEHFRKKYEERGLVVPTPAPEAKNSRRKNGTPRMSSGARSPLDRPPL